MNLANLLQETDRLAEAIPKVFAKRPAVSLGTETRLNYEDLARRVSVLAGALRQHFNLEPGSRVALTMSNCPEYVEVLFAIWHAGMIAVPTCTSPPGS